MENRAHDGHDHVHDEAAEAFPRHATAELVGREVAGRERRERWQPWLVALGVTLVALAFPTRRLLGDTLGGQGSVATDAALRVLGACGLESEPAAFLLSAVFLGLCVVPLIRIGDEHGWERGPSILVALLVVGSPIGWLAGTLPASWAAQMCGACWLAASFARRTPSVLGRCGAWLAASLLGLANAALFPALVASLADDRRRESNAAREGCLTLAALPILAAIVFAGTTWLAGGSLAVRGDDDELLAFVSDATRTFERGVREFRELLPALATFALGVAVLFVSKRRPRLLSWHTLFLAGAVIPFDLFVFGVPPRPWISLAPIAALGFFELLQRADERSRGAFARLAAVVLVVAGVGSARWVDARDPRRAWMEATAEALQPGDRVVSASGEHLDLLEHRFGVETLDARFLAPESTETQRFRLDARLEGRGEPRGRLLVDLDAEPWSSARFPPTAASRSALLEVLARFAAEHSLPILPRDPSLAPTVE